MNIIVLAGGNSTEREVSIASGQGVCKALRERNHKAVLLDPYFGASQKEENLFPTEYDVDKAADAMREMSSKLEETMKTRKGFFRTECSGNLQGSRYCISGASRSKRRRRKSTVCFGLDGN